MTELDPFVILILGAITPNVLAIINRVRWDAQEKALVAFAFAILLAVPAAWWMDAWTKDGLAATVMAVYTWQQITYSGFYKRVGWTNAIEHAILPGDVIGGGPPKG